MTMFARHNPSRNLGSLLRLLFASALIAIAIFSTTYRVGGVLFYPRLLLALAGIVLVCLRRDMRTLVWPALALLVSAGTVALVASLLHQFWGDLPLFMSLMVRGIVVPYFAAIFIGWTIGLSRMRDQSGACRIDPAAAVWIAIIFQLAVTVLHVLDLPARETFLSYLNLSDVWRDQADSGHFRFSGIGGISLYDTAISYCILAGMVLLGSRHRPTSRGPALPAAGLASVIMLTMLHGRTGLLIALLLLVILLLREIFLRVSPMSMISVRALLGIAALSLLTVSLIDERLKELILGFSGELIVNFGAGEGLRSDSTDDFIANHLRMPELVALLSGSGEWAQPDIAEVRGRPFTTDSGYLLLLQFGGIPLLVAIAGSMILMATGIFRHLSPHAAAAPRRRFLLMPIYIGSVMLLVSIKGPIFMSEHCITALFLVIAIYADEQSAVHRRIFSRSAGKLFRRPVGVVHA